MSIYCAILFVSIFFFFSVSISVLVCFLFVHYPLSFIGCVLMNRYIE